MKALLIAAVLLPSIAHADDASTSSATEAKPEKVYLPPGMFIPMVGLGMVSRGANEMSLGKRSFDGTLRESLGYPIGRVWAGGFAELRTASFETWEFGGGPQASYSFHELWLVQGRAGAAKVKDGGWYALAGVQFGTPFAAVTVTGRRYFDDHHVELSINFDITVGILLAPFMKDPFAGADFD